MSDRRCVRCDSRYCGAVCDADRPGWVYAVGRGYIPFCDAATVERQWEQRGVEYGIHHGIRRVEWDQAVPADDATDAIRVQSLLREATRGHRSMYGATVRATT